MCHFLKIGPVLYEFHHLLKFDLFKNLELRTYELGLTQTLAIAVDVISKQQIMNESARGEKSGPAGCCCCCCHSTRQILLLNTLYKRFINQAIVLRLKSLMQHYFFSFVSMSFMR